MRCLLELDTQKEKYFFPRVLGIECVGIVAETGSDKFKVGQQVAAIMGGLGRQFDGGYAEYTLVPESIVIPFKSSLDWSVFGCNSRNVSNSFWLVSAEFTVEIN